MLRSFKFLAMTFNVRMAVCHSLTLSYFRGTDAAALATQQAMIQQQILALANSPYGDSPLFRNLKQVGLISQFPIREID